MKLVNIGNRGYREYRTEDHRFHAKWTARQGTGSSYTVTDARTGKTRRAGTVAEIQEAIRDMFIEEYVGDGALPVIGDLFYDVHVPNRHSDEPPMWEVRARRVTELRVDGFALAGVGRLPWGSFGVHYHRTREAAVAAFIEGQRAIAWAEAWSPS